MKTNKREKNAPIDLLVVEYLLGQGLSSNDLADYLGCDRSGLYRRQKTDGELKAAFARGYAANERRKLRAADEVVYFCATTKRPDEDVGAKLQQSLEEIHSEVTRFRQHLAEGIEL